LETDPSNPFLERLLLWFYCITRPPVGERMNSKSYRIRRALRFPAMERLVISAWPYFFLPAVAHTARGLRADPFLVTSRTQRSKPPALFIFIGMIENPPPPSRLIRTASGSFLPGFNFLQAVTAAFTLRRRAPARLALVLRWALVICFTLR
jgi:hypothetical protein